MAKRSNLRLWSTAGVSALCLTFAVGSVLAENLTMTFEAPQYRIVRRDDSSQMIEADEFNYMLTPGKPMLPTRSLLIAVPPGARITSVDIVGNGTVELEGRFDIPPAPPMAPMNHDPRMIGNIQQTWQENYDAVYSADTFYPEVKAMYRGSGQYRKYRFATVTYTPFAYNPQSGRLKVCQSVTVTINYALPGPSEPGARIRMHDPEADRQAAEFLANFDQARAWYTPTDESEITTYSYVVIYADGLQQAAEDYCGVLSLPYPATAVWVRDIRRDYRGTDVPDKIRNFLIDKYYEWGIRYVLLLGDIADIPMRLCYPAGCVGCDPDDGVPTDTYYACLWGSWDDDGDGYHGEWPEDNPDFSFDLSVGRIPYSDEPTVTSILNKIAAFKSDTGNWKNNALLLGALANFENENGWPQTDGAWLMEHLVSYVLDDGTYTREYEKEGLEISEFACEYPLTHANAIGEWTAGDYGIVSWFAHGSHFAAARRWWAFDNGDNVPSDWEIGLEAIVEMPDVDMLDNDHPSIVFAASCMNGWPERDNLARNLLKNGAAGIVASTREAFYITGWDDPSDGGIMSIDYYFWNNVVGFEEPIGIALDNSRRKYFLEFFSEGWLDAQNLFDFCLYGDPYTLLQGDMSPCCNVRGDLNHSGEFSSADIIYFVDWLWKGGAGPVCVDEADANGSGEVSSADLMYLVDFLWKSGTAPAPCP